METSETEATNVAELPAQEQESKPKAFPEAILSDVEWEQVKQACIAGLSYREASNVFSTSYDAIKQRACREKWATPLRIEKERAEKTVTALSPEGVITPKRPETALEALSTSFEGYRSRTLLQLAKAAENGVKRMVTADLPVESWQDAQIAANIAMKLHNVGQEGVNVNVLVGGDGGFDGPLVELNETDYDVDDVDD